MTNISENGYRVEVENSSGSLSNYYCWNFVPTPRIDSIGVPFTSCDNVRLTAYTKSKILSYYDHRGDNSSINVDYGFTWTSTPKGEMDNVVEYTAMLDAPYEDTEYSVEVGAKFSPSIKSVTAHYEYKAIAVKAKFSYESEGTADNEANKGSAPMIVRFQAQSSDGETLSQGNLTSWEWTFGSGGKGFVPDPIFTFQKFGEYPVILTVKNINANCESESDPEIFNIENIVIKVPNAFTPFSSPGENDEFRVLYRSVKKYNILIYNRWGRRVYQSDNPETGWNGKIGNRKAEPGVYFYQIDAEGYNKNEKKRLEGAVQLIQIK